MAGRSNGRGRGRSSNSGGTGGRGRGNSSRSSKNRQSNPGKKINLFQVGGQAIDRYNLFDEIKIGFCTKCRATSEYSEVPRLTKAMEALKHDKPVPPDKEKVKHTVDKEGNKKYDELELAEYKAQKTRYDKEIQAYEQMMPTAAATIFLTLCTKEMQAKLRSLEDYEDNVKLDPVEMLKRIKSLVQTGTARQHPMQHFIRTLKYMATYTMDDNAMVAQHERAAKLAMHSFVELAGWSWTYKLLKNEDGYKNLTGDDQTALVEKQKKYLEAGQERVMAMYMYETLPREKFKPYENHVEGTYAAEGEDVFPTSTDQLRETLSSDRFNKPSQAYLDAKKARAKQSSGSQRPPAFDPKKKIEGVPALVYYQQKQPGEACFACGNPNHKLFKCKVKDDIPKEQWAINQFNGNRKEFLKHYHQHCQYLKQEQAPAPAPAPVQAPQFQQQQQPATSDTSSHRSGFVPIPTQLLTPTQATQYSQMEPQFQQFPTGQQQRPTSVPPQFIFRQQNTQFVLPGPAIPIQVQHIDGTQLAGVPNRAAEREVKYLDSGSSLNSTPFKELLKNIRTSQQPISMGTNAGVTQLNKQGDFPGMDSAYYNPEGMATIQSLSLTVDRLIARAQGEFVWMDTRYKDSIFIINPNTGEVEEFERMPNGLYGLRMAVPAEEHFQVHRSAGEPFGPKEEMVFVQTVLGNIEGYPKRRVAAALRARQLYHSLSHPSLKDFKNMIRAGQIRDCPVTLEAVDDAEAMFGPDMAALKGKLVKKKAPPVTNVIHAVPDELVQPHRELPATMDVFYVANKPYLAFLDLTIRDNRVEPLQSRTTNSFYSTIDAVFDYYNSNKFMIKKIHCDNEFKPLMDPVKNNLEISLDYGPAQEHANTCERFIRTLGERIRAAWHATPFLVMPKLLVDGLVKNVSMALTLFPAKEGISSVYSPRQIVTGRTISYKDLQYNFGSYCLGHHEETIKNNPEPRGLDCIYIRPLLENTQGGHELYDLTSHKVITRQYVTILPMPPAVVDKVQKKAYAEGMKPLKFHNRKKVEILPVGLPAGVTGNNAQSNEAYLQHIGYSEQDDEDSLPGVRMRVNADYSDSEDDDSVAESQAEQWWQEEPGELPNTTLMYWDEGFEDDPELNVDADLEADELELDWLPTKSNKKKSREDPIVADNSKLTGVQGHPIARIIKQAGVPKLKTYQPLRRSVRIANLAKKAAMAQKSLVNQEQPLDSKSDDDPRPLLYETEHAKQLAFFIHKKLCESSPKEQSSHAQQHLLPKGIKIWGDRARAAAHKEMDQLHNRKTWKPVHKRECTASELKKAQNAMTFVTEKRDGTIKGRTVYNGAPTRVYHDKNETRSPTVSLEGLMVSVCVDASQDRDVISLDVPNAFVQTPMPKTKPGEDRTLMRLEGELVDELLKIDPERYGPYVVYEKGRPVLYVELLMAIYGQLVASLLWYKKFKAELETIGFVFNPYDPCVANRMVNGSQQTIRFHVDDLMASHVDPQVNKDFVKWCNDMYGSYGEVKATFGPVHDYLGMTFDFSEKGKVRVDMIDYLNKTLEAFPVDLSQMKPVPSAAPADLFSSGNSEELSKDMAEVYHTFTAKLLFACKRARPDLQTLVSVLCTRVKSPTVDDWNKLLQGLKFVEQTVNDKLTLRVDDIRRITWWSDASFAVHAKDFRSHTGGVMSFGKGAVVAISSKQKLNARSSTDAELIGADDVMSPLLWTRLFLEAQGIEVQENIMFQDNKSAIILSENGKGSSGKRTRALNIRFFFIHDQINQGNLRVVYCPTTDMRADYLTKPLQGKLFHDHRAFIMGFDL